MQAPNPFQKLSGRIPDAGPGGSQQYSLGNSFEELLGMLMSEEQYGRGREEQGRRQLQKQSAAIPRQARSGVQAPQQQQSTQLAQGASQTGPVFTDQMLQAVIGQKMQMALQDQYVQQMRQIMDMNQPSGLQKYGGLGLNLLGMGVGGMMGGPAGAQLGGSIGGTLGNAAFR